MKRKNRIRKNQDFKEIINKHHIYKAPGYVIYTNKNNLGYVRVGVSISSKLGNAIIRNKIKRQIKAMLHNLIQLDKNLDIIVIAKEEFKNNTYQKNLDSLTKLIKELQ